MERKEDFATDLVIEDHPMNCVTETNLKASRQFDSAFVLSVLVSIPDHTFNMMERFKTPELLSPSRL